MQIATNKNTVIRNWSIRAVDERFMGSWSWTRKPLPHVTHQGITSWIDSGDPDSARLYDYSGEETVFYFDGERWIKLGTLSVN